MDSSTRASIESFPRLSDLEWGTKILLPAALYVVTPRSTRMAYQMLISVLLRNALTAYRMKLKEQAFWHLNTVFPLRPSYKRESEVWEVSQYTCTVLQVFQSTVLHEQHDVMIKYCKLAVRELCEGYFVGIVVIVIPWILIIMIPPLPKFSLHANFSPNSSCQKALRIKINMQTDQTVSGKLDSTERPGFVWPEWEERRSSLKNLSPSRGHSDLSDYCF